MILSMLDRCFSPEEVCVGSSSISRLSVLSRERIFILATPSSREPGCLDSVRSKLSGPSVDVTTKVKNATGFTSRLIKDLSDDMRSQGTDLILALGGGSVIDAAKLAWAQYEHSEIDLTDTDVDIPTLGEKADFAAIPTTFSGAEASISAVLTQPDGHKLPLVSHEWLPNLVLLDPRMVSSLPSNIVASTGLDAITHGVESYVSRRTHLLARQYSLRGVRLLLENLKPAYEDSDATEAIRNVQVGAFLTSLAQSTTSTGISHALSHSCSAVFGTSHSLSTSFFLIPGVKFNLENGVEEYGPLASGIGIGNIDNLLDRLYELYELFGLPNDLEGLAGRPVSSEEWTRLLDLAGEDVCARTNPAQVNPEDLSETLESVR